MKDKDKTKEQLIKELSEMRQRIAKLEALETWHKQATEASQDPEQPSSMLIEVANHLGEGIIIVQDVEDRQGAIIFTNYAFAKILEYSIEELLQMNIRDLIPPEEVQELFQRYRHRQAGETIEDHYKTLVTSKNGAKVPIEIAVSTTSYRGKPATIGFVRDITERKQAEEALQRSKEYYQALIENSFDSTIILNKDGSIRYINPSLERPFGWDPEELIGKAIVDLVHPDYMPYVTEAFNEGAQVLGYTKLLELKVLGKDGSWLTVECVGSNLLDHPAIEGIVVNIRDITERRQAEEALQRSNEHFQALIENAFDTIMVFSDDLSVGYVSPSIKRTLGYEPEEWIGKNLFDFAHPDDLQKAINLHDRQIQTPGYTGFMELRAKHKDGSWRTIQGASINLLDNPSVEGIVANFHDITDYRQKEKNYTELIEDINDGYLVFQDEKIVLANQRLADIFGYTLDQVLGKDFFTFMAPEARQQIIEMYTRVISGEEEAPEYYKLSGIKGDGTRILFDVGIKSIDYDGKPAFSVIVRDITERKQIEQKYRQLVEDMQDGYAVLQDGNIVFANERFGEIFGYEPAQVTGRIMTQFIAPDSLREIMDLYAKVINGLEETPELIETTGMKSDRTTFPIQGGVKQIEYEGKPAYSIIVRDITEQKKAQHRLQELYERELKLRETLEEERKRRIDFTRVLVHELKTPLTPVMAASELLVDELQEGTLKRLANNINRGALNLSNRVDDLLDLARGEIGTLQLNFESVDLLCLIHKVADYMAPVASSYDHSLILDLPQSLPPVRADKNRLQQVMLNLLNNASKFTPSGGEITLRAGRKNSTLIVEVQDTGTGIPEEQQQRLFKPYYRVESDRQRMSGLGLGLALCKTIVELHGGGIWVKSHLDKGSTFGFSLPLKDQRFAPDSRKPATEKRSEVAART